MVSITDPIPPAGWWVCVVTGLLAVVAAVSTVGRRTSWVGRIAFGFNVVSTALHEAGHALAACVTGGGVWVIRVHTPDSGVTSSWSPSRMSDLVTTLAGYATPPLAGLGAASLLSRGHAPMVLALTVAAMILILIVTRDLITLGSVLSVGGIAAVALYWGPVWMQQWVTYTEAWVLLVSEVAGVWVITYPRLRRRAGSSTGDAGRLALDTGIPALVWSVVWWVLNGWAIWTALPLLWP